MRSLWIPNVRIVRLHLGSKLWNSPYIAPKISNRSIRSYGYIWVMHTMDISAKFFSSHPAETLHDSVSGRTTPAQQVSTSGDLWLLRNCHPNAAYSHIVTHGSEIFKVQKFWKKFFLAYRLRFRRNVWEHNIWWCAKFQISLMHGWWENAIHMRLLGK